MHASGRGTEAEVRAVAVAMAMVMGTLRKEAGGGGDGAGRWAANFGGEWPCCLRSARSRWMARLVAGAVGCYVHTTNNALSLLLYYNFNKQPESLARVPN